MSSEDYNAPETFSFPTKGRERWVPSMQRAGYVEIPSFEGKESKTVGYWCESCPYYSHMETSPTGAWCLKFNFPDRGHGCCGGWVPNRGIRP